MLNLKKKNILIIIVSTLIIGVLLCLYIYHINYTDNNGEDLIDDLENLIYKLDVYKDDNNLCLTKSDTCKDIAYSIPVKDINAKVKGFDIDYKFILYEDSNNLRIYNTLLDEIDGVLLKNIYKEYKLYKSESGLNIIGISYKTKNNKIGYYNVVDDIKLYEGKYSNEFNQISNDYLTVTDSDYIYLLSSKESKEIIKYKLSNQFVKISSLENNNYSFLLMDNNNVKKITIDGKITNYKEYNKVLDIINNYVVFIDNNQLKLENILTNEVINIDDLKDNYIYDNYNSRYYHSGYLSFNDEGIYLIINYKNEDLKNIYCYTKDGSVKKY